MENLELKRFLTGLAKQASSKINNRFVFVDAMTRQELFDFASSRGLCVGQAGSDYPASVYYVQGLGVDNCFTIAKDDESGEFFFMAA